MGQKKRAGRSEKFARNGDIRKKFLGECTEELKAPQLGNCSEGHRFDQGRDGAVVMIFKVGGYCCIRWHFRRKNLVIQGNR